MALFTIKPSRGTVAFFAVLALGVAANFGWRRHEVQLVERDAPPVLLARRALRCVLGRDVERMLWPRPADGDTAAWEAKINERLRRLVSAQHGEGHSEGHGGEHAGGEWPGRCVPLLDRLADRVRDDSRTVHIYRMSFELRDALLSFSRDPMAGMERVENGSLGSELAGFTMTVSSVSLGAEAGWSTPLAEAPTDLWPVAQAAAPLPWFLPPEADYATLAQPDVLLYQSALDRRFHSVLFAPGAPPTDTPFGVGAPVRSAPRDGAVLVASDGDDEVLLPGGGPALLVPLPEPIRAGRQATGLWQVALTHDWLWLLTEDRGTLRLWRTPRDGRQSEVPWGEPQGTLGGRDVMLGGAIAPDPESPNALAVLSVRRGARGVLMERTLFDTPAESRRGGAPRGDAAGDSVMVGVDAVALGTTSLGTELPAFDPHLLSCSAGATQYLLISSDESITVARAAGGAFARLELWYTTWGAPTGTRFEVTCNAHGLLLFADLAYRPGSLVYFDFDKSEHRTVNPPAWGPGAHVIAGALTEHHGIVAVVKNGATVRAYRSRPGSESEEATAAWEGGALLALRDGVGTVTASGERPANDFVWDVGAVAASGDEVALLVQMPMMGRMMVGRVASRDGGASWR